MSANRCDHGVDCGVHVHDPISSLEAEGTLAADLSDAALAAVAAQFDHAGSHVSRVVDLGCGPGIGTVALAKAFPDATVVAVDSSAPMLERTAARAAESGLGARVATRLLDLNGDLLALERCDLVWASMSIHHTADEVATLRALRTLIAPDGLACILERAAPLSVRCADELGRPGIWERLEDAHRRWYEHHRSHLPGAMNADDYPTMLAEAGLRLVFAETLSRHVALPDDPAMHAFAAGSLRRSVTNLAGLADADDLTAIDGLLDGAAPSPAVWEGARVAISRKVFIARIS